jgi:hypothetical protein
VSKRVLPTVILVFVGLWVTALADVSPLERYLVQDRLGDVVIRMPLSNSAAEVVAWRIAMSARVLVGFEASATEIPSPVEPFTRVLLTGQTVRSALDTLVKLDSRYRWEELNGVVVIRPVAAWNDPNDPLNQSVETVSWDNMSPGSAGRSVGVLMHKPAPASVPFPSPERTFSVHVASATVLDVLNQIVRSHGELSWTVSFKNDLNAPRHSLAISLKDFDAHVSTSSWP